MRRLSRTVAVVAVASVGILGAATSTGAAPDAASGTAPTPTAASAASGPAGDPVSWNSKLLARDSFEEPGSALAVSSTGQQVVAWSSDSGVLLRLRSPEGVWSDPVGVPDSAVSAVGLLSVAVDLAGNMCVVPVRNGEGPLHAACTDPDTGIFEPTASSRARPREGPFELVVDENGVFTLAWIQRDEDNYVELAVSRRHAGEPWSAVTVLSDPGSTVASFDLAASPDGVVTAVWAEKQQYNPSSPYRVMSTTLRGATWTAPVRLSPLRRSQPQIAAGRSGKAVVVWRSPSTRQVEARVRTPQGWSPTQKMPTDVNSYYPTVAYGAGTAAVGWVIQHPAVRALVGPATLWVTRWRNGRWHTADRLDRAADKAAAAPQLAIGRGGTIYATWLDKAKQDPIGDNYNLFAREYVHHAWTPTEILNNDQEGFPYFYEGTLKTTPAGDAAFTWTGHHKTWYATTVATP